jgi:DNA transposition AAA+ family ATPase
MEVSGATLSKIEADNWESINEKLWRKIWLYVGNDMTPEIFETADYSACINACEMARKNRFMVGLTGDTGMGKTTALHNHAMQKNTFYLVCEKSMKPKRFFANMLKEMGISLDASIYEMVNRIVDELNSLCNPLLIIDEAGKITQTIMLYLHDLRNKTNRNCGILLGGMPNLRTNLIKGSNKEKEGYAEFLRRIQVWHSLKGLSRKEIEIICKDYGITDTETIREMMPNKRFGDLYNAILLHQLDIKEQS